MDKNIINNIKLLIATATYNEAENITELITQIKDNISNVDILVIDDNSPDGTSEIVEKLIFSDPRINLIKRKSRLGVGSAHQLAMSYAIQGNYEILVTLDADLSHNPAEINSLILKLNGADFVIGARYINGASSNISGYRNFISRGGNIVARLFLKTHIHEYTSSFRAFRVQSLRKINHENINCKGNSFFLEIIFYLNKAGLRLDEIPIQFKDRTLGTSKISLMEILWGFLKLLDLTFKK